MISDVKHIEAFATSHLEEENRFFSPERSSYDLSMMDCPQTPCYESIQRSYSINEKTADMIFDTYININTDTICPKAPQLDCAKEKQVTQTYENSTNDTNYRPLSTDHNIFMAPNLLNSFDDQQNENILEPGSDEISDSSTKENSIKAAKKVFSTRRGKKKLLEKEENFHYGHVPRKKKPDGVRKKIKTKFVNHFVIKEANRLLEIINIKEKKIIKLSQICMSQIDLKSQKKIV